MAFESENNETDCPMSKAKDYLPSYKPRTSPQRSPPHTLSSKKEKRQPSVTPRKFTRFFTPRSHGPFAASSSRRALNDITAPARNRNGIQSSPLPPVNGFGGQENSQIAFTRDMKRRKLLHTPSPSPEDSSPEKSSKFSRPCDFHGEGVEEYSDIYTSPYQPNTEERCNKEHKQARSITCPPARRIQQLEARGLAGRLVQLSLGYSGRSTRQRFSKPAAG